ncbi:DUF2586 family protein [Deinococcus petrolearius]|uniref:DUF2586 family protein n=1 Tax=Deinococcus petrolearius TaxID=1751295 RepID=A0ABW1DDN6_9DEIO
MTLAKIIVNFDDYQLGLAPAITDAHAKIGVAADGPFTPQRLTRGTQAAELYRGGPLAGAAAVALMQTSPVVAVRVPATTAGTLTSVTRAGTTGTSIPAVAGPPNDAYAFSIAVTRSGTVAAGDAAVEVSVNGQAGSERAVPAGGVLAISGTDVTATFAAGTLVAGETYAFSSAAPTATVADIATTLEDLLSTRPDLRYVHVLGSTTPALAAAVDAILTERATRNHYLHAILEARPMATGETASTYLAAIEAQFAAFASTRVGIALDGGEVYNPLTRQLEYRNSAWKLTGQRATRPIGEAAYRVRTGPVPAMGGLRFDANLVGTSGRFAALRTFDGREGVYVANWPTMAPSGSDYGEVQRREVIDRAAAIGFISAMDYLGADIPVDITTGRVLETAAAAFDTFVEGRVRAGLGANASGVRVRMDREENILSTEHLRFTLSVIPLGYAHRITVNVGFLNPLLAAQAAAAPAATEGDS